MSREQQSFEVRVQAARLARDRDNVKQTPRGDDTRTKVGTYTKGLPHVLNTGVLENPPDLDLFVKAIDTGDFADIRAIPLGPRGPKNDRFVSGIAKGNGKPGAGKGGIVDVRAWESMAAGNAFDLQGPDSQSVAMPPHPALDSEELIAEMTEIYWMSLCRDVPFSAFDNNGRIGKAVDDMNETKWVQFKKNPPRRLSKEERARLRGPFNRGTVFRGVLEGDNIGPYLSQFLLCGTNGIKGGDTPSDGFITYGAHRIDQRVRYVEPEKDYMTTWASWLDVQNGADLRGQETYEKGYRFIATPRDLCTYVHYDALYQAYLNTCIILLSIKAKFDEGIPFTDDDNIDKQQGFALFGGPHILTLVTEVATRALKAVRYQKFNIHRRPRPERLAGLIERYHHEPKSDLYLPVASLYKGLDKGLLNRVARENAEQNKKYCDRGNRRSDDYDPRGSTGENRLLPMAFPEGSPMHPSYGAGHATVAGACVTVLKAWFKTDEELPFVFEPNREGTRLIERKDMKLTIEHELNKVCSNICIGRNWGGVHYFTDYYESIKIGEEVAIGMLEEQMLTYKEKFRMTFNRFDGTECVITNMKN